MPYRSIQQMRYMHAQHPEIAEKWDAEVRAQKKKGKYRKPPRKIHKSNSGWLKPLSIGVVGGAVANQFPSVGEMAAEAKRENRRQQRKRKAAKVSKLMAPEHPDDGWYNHQAAQEAFDLVMKMDDDTAEMFTTIVVSDIFETTVEKNLGTLQRHLDQVLAKRLKDVKNAHLRMVSKGMDHDQAVAYAQTLSLIEKASEFERLHPRGHAGRFRTKITHNQTRPIRGKTFEAMAGVQTPKEHNGNKLSDEDRARFQDEYRQLSDFLNSVDASTGKGNAEIFLHYRDKNGNDFTQRHAGTKPPTGDLADPSFRLMAAEAHPTTLTAGGAAFGLASALGGSLSADQIRGLNAADVKSGEFTNQWLGAGAGSKASNEKLYGRLSTSGQFLQTVAPGSSKAQLAGRFAEIIGNHGPEAEAVLGPSARKTAYRYRGTERTPDKRLVRAYGDAVQQGKRFGLAEEEPEPLRRGQGRGVSHGSMVAAGSRTKPTQRKGQPGAGPSLQEMSAQREATRERVPTWQERALGRQTVVQYLREKERFPDKKLYALQLASGNTPPSEGVILNAQGQIASQAVGYGDDHYLPFNLKNLKALKGGEYIRTRSVGGLTSEDIYTGLISGARQVTVTSRSGTYIMTFEPDFRGGRRHNDKARRMTRRYEQLLDAVQSQQVERGDIDPEMRQQIENEVKEEMSGPGWRRSDIQDAVKERIDEFKENPYISEQDEKRAEAIINARAAGADDKERAKIRSEVYDDLLDQKETRFRLNSEGYRAALDALAEQFPYYIKTRYIPARDTERRIETERDLGYVEPGRNRPTAASAGLFGTVKGKSGKFSAAQADYQGASALRRGGSAEVGEPGATGEGTGAKTPDVHAERRKKIAESKMEYAVGATAKKIQDSARGRLKDEDLENHKDVLSYTAEDLKNPTKLSKFSSFVTTYLDNPAIKEPGLKREWEQAVGHRERTKYDPGNLGVYPKQPPLFEEEPYELGADKTKRDREADKVDRKSRGGVVVPLPYSHQSEAEWEQEHRALSQMYQMLTEQPGVKLNNDDLDALGVDTSSPALSRGLRSDPERVKEQMEYLQRARALTTSMSNEERDARVNAPIKEVRTSEPQTTEERSASDATVEGNLTWARRIQSGLKNEGKTIDEVEENLVSGFIQQLEEGQKDIRSPSDMASFLAAHKDQIDRLQAIEARQRRPKE